MVNLASNEQSAPLEPSVRRPLLWLALGFTVGSACLIALALSFLRNQAIESGIRLTQSFAQVIEEQTTRTVQTIDQRLQLASASMAQLDAAGQLNEQSARALLRQQVKELPFVRAMWVMDALGRIQYDSDEGNIGVSLVDRPYFQIYRTQPLTGFYLGTPVRSRSTGTWLISAARPLHSSSGGFAGIIVAAVEPPYFDKLWRAIDLGTDGSIALLRSDGVLMMRSPFKDDAMGKKLPDNPLFSKYLPASPNGSYLNKSVIDGTLRSFAYRTLSARPALVVVVGQSFELMLAPWRQLASLTLAIWAAASAAVIFLCVFLNRAWQQRVRAEASTELLAKRLTLATEAASIGVWDWDLTTDQWYATPTYFTLLGYEPAAGPSERAAWLERVHPDDRQAVAHAIAGAVNSSNVPHQYEARMRHADGSWRWIAVVGKIVEHSANGSASRMRGVTLDMTERRRAEAAVRESEARLNEAQHHAHIGSWCYLPPATYIGSDEMYQLFQLPRDLPVSHEAVLAVIHPVDRDAGLQHAFRRAIESGAESFEAEFRVVWPDGQVRALILIGKFRRETDGRLIEAVGTVQDVTERKQVEEKVREQLDELLRWQAVTLGREHRLQELKAEVNELLAAQRQPARYNSETGP